MKIGFSLKAVPAIFVGDLIAKTLQGVESLVGTIIEAINFKGKSRFSSTDDTAFIVI